MKLTCGECGGVNITAMGSSMGHDGHLILSVRLQTVNAVLLVWGENVCTGFICGVGGGCIRHGDFVYRRHRLRPADQSRGVRHIFHLNLRGAVKFWVGSWGEEGERMEARVSHTKKWVQLCYLINSDQITERNRLKMMKQRAKETTFSIQMRDVCKTCWSI